MSELFRTLYGYQAWANSDLLGKLELLDPKTHETELHTTIRLISHYHVVARIFAAHLSGTKHQYASANTVETPTLSELKASVTATDRWYQDYVQQVTAQMLSEPVVFTFTDGDKGCMTRQEMLMHVALHSAIHRGEVCRILSQLSITPPWDTFAVYLHEAEPSRRQHGSSKETVPAN
jgi:uncharacterized damage-inducible protein DinB